MGAFDNQMDGADGFDAERAPRISGGLLDPSTFPFRDPGEPASGYPTLARQTADADVNAEVSRDLQKAHAALLARAPTVMGGFRHIDEYPGMNYAPPGRFPRPTTQSLRDFMNGGPLPKDAFGPHITFVNDEPRNPSPDQSVTNATATMVERGVVNSGVRSVNINSTTGGVHDAGGRHPMKRAIDIDMVDDLPVSAANSASQRLQDAMASQPNIRENFGPGFQTKTFPGRSAVAWPKMRKMHGNHDHFSGQD